MRTLGKKYGKLLKAIGEKLATLDGNEVVAGFEKGELLRFELDGTAMGRAGKGRRADRADAEAGLCRGD